MADPTLPITLGGLTGILATVIGFAVWFTRLQASSSAERDKQYAATQKRLDDLTEKRENDAANARRALDDRNANLDKTLETVIDFVGKSVDKLGTITDQFSDITTQFSESMRKNAETMAIIAAQQQTQISDIHEIISGMKPEDTQKRLSLAIKDIVDQVQSSRVQFGGDIMIQVNAELGDIRNDLGEIKSQNNQVIVDQTRILGKIERVDGLLTSVTETFNKSSTNTATPDNPSDANVSPQS